MIKSNNNVYQGKFEDFMYNYIDNFLGEKYQLSSVERKEIVEDLLKKFIKNQSPSLLNDVNNIKCDNKYNHIKNFIINHLTSDNQLTSLNTYMILDYIKYLKECEKLEENDIQKEITKVTEQCDFKDLDLIITSECEETSEVRILKDILQFKVDKKESEELLNIVNNFANKNNTVKRRVM